MRYFIVQDRRLERIAKPRLVAIFAFVRTFFGMRCLDRFVFEWCFGFNGWSWVSLAGDHMSVRFGLEAGI